MSFWQKIMQLLKSPKSEGRFLFVKPKRKVTRIFLHCSASDLSHHDDIGIIKQWHTRPKPVGNGWVDVGYHYYITKNGTIQEGRPLSKIPAAQYPYNSKTIAICLGGLKEFSEEQFDSLRKLCKAINDSYEGKVTFHGHKEVSNKSCPVYNYKKVLGLDSKGRLRG